MQVSEIQYERYMPSECKKSHNMQLIELNGEQWKRKCEGQFWVVSKGS